MKILFNIILITLSFSLLLKGLEVKAETTGTVKAFKYNDYKGDGIFNQQDHGLAEWKICLSSETLEIPSCKITDETGWVYWENESQGTFSLYEEATKTQIESGWYQTEPIQNGRYRVVVDEESTKYYFGGKQVEEAYFGNRLAEIHGHVAYDSNKNGTYDTTDLLLGGWQAYLDLNKNGVLDNGQVWHGCGESSNIRDCLEEGSEPYLCSNSLDGSWHFRDIPKGTYTARLVLKDGWDFSAGGQSYFTKYVEGGIGVVWSDLLVLPTDNIEVSSENSVFECDGISETIPLGPSPTPLPSPLTSVEPSPLPTPLPTPTKIEYIFNYQKNRLTQIFIFMRHQFSLLFSPFRQFE